MSADSVFILDPFEGTGGFYISSIVVIKNKYGGKPGFFKGTIDIYMHDFDGTKDMHKKFVRNREGGTKRFTRQALCSTRKG